MQSLQDHFSQPHRECFPPRCWKSGTRRLSKPQVQKEQCGFCPACGEVDQIFKLLGFLKRSLEFDKVCFCFVVLGRVTTNQVPQGTLWKVLQENGVPGSPLRPAWSLYNPSKSCVLILTSLLDWTLAVRPFASNPVCGVHRLDLKA